MVGFALTEIFGRLSLSEAEPASASVTINDRAMNLIKPL